MSHALGRHHRRRIIAKHVRQYCEQFSGEPLPPVAAATYVGCQRPRCGICHPHELDNLDRSRAERERRRIEEVAWWDGPGDSPGRRDNKEPPNVGRSSGAPA